MSFPYPVYVLSEFRDACGLLDPSQTASAPDHSLVVFRCSTNGMASFRPTSTAVAPGVFSLFTSEPAFWAAVGTLHPLPLAGQRMETRH